MNVERAHFRRAGRDHILTTQPCAVCGHVGRFLDLPAGTRITHTCPGRRCGPTWTVFQPWCPA